MTCRILVPWTRIEAGASVVKAQTPNHCTAREFPIAALYISKLTKCDKEWEGVDQSNERYLSFPLLSFPFFPSPSVSPFCLSFLHSSSLSLSLSVTCTHTITRHRLNGGESVSSFHPALGRTPDLQSFLFFVSWAQEKPNSYFISSLLSLLRHVMNTI